MNTAHTGVSPDSEDHIIVVLCIFRYYAYGHAARPGVTRVITHEVTFSLLLYFVCFALLCIALPRIGFATHCFALLCIDLSSFAVL